ncbi:hypothetical protein SAMN05216359_102497 [Roseateles sp. YR242]|uniref:hypothetical protein n=1 Tax=Roseateles sp. YR242 TaxID=1855305 RepID=UPI0008C72552|nr:hypothetical protein [Roseateles sp. YR242]SEK63833.1 hypothetical protein SAMN05216359_102497 [Roseateles sp. YR242]
MAVTTDGYIDEMKGMAQQTRDFSLEMLKYNVDQQMASMTSDAAIKNINGLVGQPGKLNPVQ